MKRKLFYGGAAVAVLIIAGIAYALRPSPEATAPIEAVPLEIATDVPVTEPPATELPESSAATPTAGDPQTESGSELFASSAPVVYTISQAESEVRFSIDELLRNVPTTAVGITDQVAGELAIDFTMPSNSQIGPITVNARTLATDNNNRNRMIRNEILDTGDFEFIVFTPSSISGLPVAFNPGETVSFQISGDLMIRDITAPAVFDVSATVDETGRLSGTASAVVLRADYGLVIPSVPSVAGVSDEVFLEIDFVAYPK